jgi:hypothetical protein
MTDRIPDFSEPEYEILPFYTVVETFSFETGKHIGLWLWRLARSACTEDNLPYDKNIIPLILRPDKKWKIIKSKRKETYRPKSFTIWSDPWAPMERAGSRLIYYDVPWSLEESVLNSFLSAFVNVPVDDRSFKGIDINLKSEGVCIHRADFKEWCIDSEYPLPRFWFGNAADEQQKRSAGKELADSRHKKTRPSNAAINEIVNAIRNKVAQGDYFHQMNEIDAWMKNNPGTKTTRDRFKKCVNAELKKHGIQPVSNAPPKK